MSKAFTKEDSENEEELPESSGPSLPSGAKNYITPGGAKRLKEEHRHLSCVERPKVVEVVSWAASLGDRSENADYIYGKKRLKEIDRKIRFLERRLRNIEIVDPAIRKHTDRIFFGATVTVSDEQSVRKTYHIVGVDETDASRGKVSWISPIGRVLLKASVGDEVTLKSPKGEIALEILEVKYKAIE